MKELNEYPNLIFLATKKLAEIDNAIAILNLTLSRQEAIVEARLAFDTTLKNEPQRKATLLEELGDRHQGSKYELLGMRHDRSLYAASLQQLESEFKILTLVMRLKIALQSTAE